MLISSTQLIPVFPIYSLVQDPRGPASFYTHARNNATTGMSKVKGINTVEKEGDKI